MILNVLPKRHRNHQLETESVRHFQSLLPSSWIYRTPSDDYGIDGEVEIFDNEGNATGKKFLLQLKATDEEDVNKALKLRLPIEKGNYFDSLALPVLVVRYLAMGKRVFVRWFHSFDPYWESVTENSFAFNYSETDEWFEGREELIVDELDEYLNLNVNKHPFPITLPIYFSHNFPMASEAVNLAAQTLKLAEKYEDIIKLKLLPMTDRRPPTHILFNDDKLHVVLANRTGSCLHFPDGLDNEAKGNIASEIFVGIGLGLFSKGYRVEAGRLLADNINASFLKHDVRATSAVVAGLIHARQLEKVLEFTEKLFSVDVGINAGQSALVAVINYFDRSDIQEIRLLSDALKKISDSLQKRGIYKVASVVEYNHANILRSCENMLKVAITHYNLAAKLDGEYRNRSYWLAEVAGCLFLLGRFRFSSKFYKASIIAKPDSHIRALYADSLMYSGQLTGALDEFDNFFKEDKSGHFHAEWILKDICLQAIVDKFELEYQPPYRGDYDINELIASDPDSFVRYLRENDIFCGEVWFHLGINLTHQERHQDALICFLMSAFTEHSVLESWSNALSCSALGEATELTPVILQCAFSKYGQEFLLFFSEAHPLKEGSDRIDAQMKIMELMQFLSQFRNTKSNFLVRMHGPDGSYDDVVTSGDNEAKLMGTEEIK